jgi:diguanylate cyclase (GGDEF)-like protein
MDAKTLAGAGPLFLLVVIMGWLSLRFGPALASLGVVTSSVWISAGALHGTGAFASATPDSADAVLAAQIYITVLASGVLLLSVYANYSVEQDATARRTAEILSSAADSAATQVFIKHYDPAIDRFRYVEVNENFASDLGLQASQVVGLSDEDLHNPAAAARFREQDELVFTSGERHRFETVVTLHGRRIAYFASKFPVHDRKGQIIGVGGVSLDRTDERRRAAMLQLVFDRSPVPTARLACTPEGIGAVLAVNDAFATLLSVPADRLVRQRLDELLVGTSTLFDPRGPRTQRREVRLRRQDGSELSVVATTTAVSEEVEDPFALVILEDVTATRAAEAGLVHRATHDPLTDLFNRQALVERLTSRGSTVPAGVALWCCDLDGFKQFNDSLGHDTGDRVLLEVAQRVRDTVGIHDTVGRLGADEFVVFSGPLLDVETALLLGEQIRSAVAEPLEMDGRTHSVRVSVGLAVSDGEVNAEELLRQADVALSRAKDLGRDRIEIYLPELDRRVQLRSAVRETLRKALAENRIGIQAQPLVNLSTGATAGAEALVRLHDLDGTILPPAAFIGVAEDSGLIMPLGMRVLDLSLALCARWLEQGTPVEIAVNVSPRQLQEADFPTTVATLLQIHGVPADLLVLEVTESTVVDATGPTLEVLRQLRDSGVHVAIDDFGTGYSSLSSLRDLPADIVKIDRSFVAGLASDSGDEAIVRAVLAMAHATDRVVVAEGVETLVQAQRLAELNCDLVQGYWFSRPLAPIDFNPTRHYEVQATHREQSHPTSQE